MKSTKNGREYSESYFKFMRSQTILFFGFLLGWTWSSGGASVGIVPVADTTLQSAFPTLNFGGGTTMTAGERRFGGSTRGLMVFNVAGVLPPGAVIESASLSLTVVRSPVGGIASTFDLHRLTASWGEGRGQDQGGSTALANEATWENRFGASGSPWTTPGGDFVSTVSSSHTIGAAGNYVFASSAQMVADIQSWYNDPADNFGWILMSESEGVNTTIQRFGTHEDKDTSPVLTISFTVVPEPAAGALIGLGLALLLCKRMKNSRPTQR